ncbi:Solute carrier family 25 member 35 [Eumeta japonica]|uniref:Solute carrier family 25 member 35 n=1 Tax=Eumeta variegata TaxID=151549 RepID=A0A4C1XXP1_EUMVA|nr:Solute carrier family 25 member 35 [Eumeta japonica]
MDFLIGGVAGAGASFFTNPMDVIKTRLQLQGELKAPDSYKVRYRGFLHAIYVITKMDGITALQSGLTPALLLGFSLNFVRLGLYRKVERLGWINDENGGTSVWKAAFLASVSGGLSGITATPSFVVKARDSFKKEPGLDRFDEHYGGGAGTC